MFFFKQGGIIPDKRDSFTTVVIDSIRSSMCWNKNCVEIGLSKHYFAGDFRMNDLTSLSVRDLKLENLPLAKTDWHWHVHFN